MLTSWCYRYLLAGLLCLSMLPLSAATYFVRQGGNDQANGKTPATAVRTLLRAVQLFNHGDTVVIGPGRYRESAFLADRFGSEQLRMAILGDENGQRTGDAPGAVVIEPLNQMEPALHCYRVKHVTISGLTFQGGGQGLKMEKSLDVLLERTTFDGMAKGFTADGVQDLRIESSVFTRCAISAAIQNSVRVRLAHNSIATSSAIGILALNSSLGTVRNCLFSNNATNLTADASSSASWSSDYNVLTGGAGPWGAVPTIHNIYEWNAISGQDRHSVHVAPEFVNPTTHDVRIKATVSWAGGLPGQFIGQPLTPKVEFDRDGKPFREQNGALCAGAYEYPDAQPGNGWQKLAVTLPAGGPRQSAGIYRPDGTLVRTLLADAAGIREVWWNGLDDLGKVAGTGPFEFRAIAHDVRIVDDGPMGDNGNPKGAYHCDNADRVLTLPDGSFYITAVYDEAGFAVRRYASSGQSVFATALVEDQFWGLGLRGEDVIAGTGKGAAARLVRLVAPGERAMMATGAEAYPVTTEAEAAAAPVGLTVVGDTAYVALGGLNLVRKVNLTTGAREGDLPVANVGDISADATGQVWVLSGTDIVSLNADGQIGKRYPTGLATPIYLAAGPGKLAAVDRAAEKIALLDASTGNVLRTLGQARTPGAWAPVQADRFRNPRGAAFFPDGRLIVTESARVRVLWPETAVLAYDMISNFMDVAVPHPLNPEYVYCFNGSVFHVDPVSGAWQWVNEGRNAVPGTDSQGNPIHINLGSPSTAVVLGGRPFLVFFTASTNGGLKFVDISNPVEPRMALEYGNEHKIFSAWAYATIGFTTEGDIISGGHYNHKFARVKFTGLDAQQNPTYDFATPIALGQETDPATLRNMKPIASLAPDRTTGDLYYLAVTDQYNKMVPGWGADGTGVGRSTANGAPLWFALSSGGNYMSVSTINDGANAWVLAGKSFGGQLDLFNADGLRLTTGNWSWPSHYMIGFVDLRYGVQAYLRADGKPGAYVEDDAIGRFARARIDGAETLQRVVTPVTLAAPAAADALLQTVDAVEGARLMRMATIPKVTPLAMDGNWEQWAQQGVSPQIIALPSNVGFKRLMADDLMQNFREGAYLGAVAHDGANIYVYFVATDDSPHFNAAQPGSLWQFDGIELWLEEEQIGLGFLKTGAPALFKWRHHDPTGKQWAANYPLPSENIWGSVIADLSSHTLGRQLATMTGVSFQGKTGYALMAKIPFNEVRLVGGIGGRTGTDILPTTGAAGEILRIGVALNNISAWGRSQDYQVDWPVGKMYSDPTRSYPFKFGE